MKDDAKHCWTTPKQLGTRRPCYWTYEHQTAALNATMANYGMRVGEEIQPPYQTEAYITFFPLYAYIILPFPLFFFTKLPIKELQSLALLIILYDFPPQHSSLYIKVAYWTRNEDEVAAKQQQMTDESRRNPERRERAEALPEGKTTGGSTAPTIV